MRHGHGDAHPEHHDGEHPRRADPGVAPAEAGRPDLDDPNTCGRRADEGLSGAVHRNAHGGGADGVHRVVRPVVLGLRRLRLARGGRVGRAKILLLGHCRRAGAQRDRDGGDGEVVDPKHLEPPVR
jgi:hypothetical protein